MDTMDHEGKRKKQRARDGGGDAGGGTWIDGSIAEAGLRYGDLRRLATSAQKGRCWPSLA